MATVGQARATLDDLYRTEGQAELIGGRIVQYMATGVRPSETAGNIYVSRLAVFGGAIYATASTFFRSTSLNVPTLKPSASTSKTPLPLSLNFNPISRKNVRVFFRAGVRLLHAPSLALLSQTLGGWSKGG